LGFSVDPIDKDHGLSCFFVATGQDTGPFSSYLPVAEVENVPFSEALRRDTTGLFFSSFLFFLVATSTSLRQAETCRRPSFLLPFPLLSPGEERLRSNSRSRHRVRPGAFFSPLSRFSLEVLQKGCRTRLPFLSSSALMI